MERGRRYLKYVKITLKCKGFNGNYLELRQYVCKIVGLHVNIHLLLTFHYQLMHLLIKTLSQFTFKTTHVKNVCDAYLKLILKTQHVSVSPPTIIRGQFPYLAQLLRVSLPACLLVSVASQTFLTCVVLNVNCESVLINKCMSW